LGEQFGSKLFRGMARKQRPDNGDIETAIVLEVLRPERDILELASERSEGTVLMSRIMASGLDSMLPAVSRTGPT
jgi:hypothetical protein